MFGQKDYLIVKGIARGMELLEDSRYIREEELEDEVDLDNNPDFETVEEGENYTIYSPKSNQDEVSTEVKKTMSGNEDDAPSSYSELLEETYQVLDDARDYIDNDLAEAAEAALDQVDDAQSAAEAMYATLQSMRQGFARRDRLDVEAQDALLGRVEGLYDDVQEYGDQVGAAVDQMEDVTDYLDARAGLTDNDERLLEENDNIDDVLEEHVR